MNGLSGKRLPSLGEDPFFDMSLENKKLIAKMWKAAEAKLEEAYKDMGTIMVFGTAGCHVMDDDAFGAYDGFEAMFNNPEAYKLRKKDDRDYTFNL